MNKVVWTKQKVTGVMISKFLIILITLCNINLFSQENITGKYSKTYSLMEFHTTYEFNENGLFEYLNYKGGHLNNYGKGHYFINKKKLILNYDLTELKTNHYYKPKYYKNSKDTVEVKIKVHDMNNKPLTDILVGNLSYPGEIRTNNNGEVTLKFKKESKTETISIINENYGYYFIPISINLNSILEVFLNENPTNSSPLKGDIIKYKIIKKTNEYIKLRTDKKEIIILKKMKE